MPKRQRDESRGVEIVRLNVGGTVFTTSRATLCAVPDSLLGQMFDPDSGFGSLPTDEAGHVFLDRDSEVFRWILDFLRRRGRSVGLPRVELRPLLRDDADYFGLVGLVTACDEMGSLDVPLLHEIRSVGGHVSAVAKKMDAINTTLVSSVEVMDDMFSGLQESIGTLSNGIYNPQGRGPESDIHGVLKGILNHLTYKS